jgi:hypothetical protein
MPITEVPTRPSDRQLKLFAGDGPLLGVNPSGSRSNNISALQTARSAPLPPEDGVGGRKPSLRPVPSERQTLASQPEETAQRFPSADESFDHDLLDGMSLDQRRSFIAAVEEGGFSAAWRRLCRAYRGAWLPPGPAGRWLIQSLKRPAGTESLRKTDGAKRKRRAEVRRWWDLQRCLPLRDPLNHGFAIGLRIDLNACHRHLLR